MGDEYDIINIITDCNKYLSSLNTRSGTDLYKFVTQLYSSDKNIIIIIIDFLVYRGINSFKLSVCHVEDMFFMAHALKMYAEKNEDIIRVIKLQKYIREIEDRIEANIWSQKCPELYFFHYSILFEFERREQIIRELIINEINKHESDPSLLVRLGAIYGIIVDSDSIMDKLYDKLHAYGKKYYTKLLHKKEYIINASEKMIKELNNGDTHIKRLDKYTRLHRYAKRLENYTKKLSSITF